MLAVEQCNRNRQREESGATRGNSREIQSVEVTLDLCRHSEHGAQGRSCWNIDTSLTLRPR